MKLLIKYIDFFKKKNVYSFLVVMIVSFITYVINIGTSPLWYDELFSLFWSQLKTAEEVKNVSYWDVAPPGYNLLMHYWTNIFGLSEFAVRGLSCFCASVAAGLMYLMVKNILGFTSAVISVILFLTSSVVYYYANEARCFSFLLMLTVLSSILFIELINKPRLLYVIALGLVNYYLFYTHFSIIFLFVGQFIFAMFYFKNNLLNWYLVSCMVLIALLLPFLPRVLTLATNNGQNHWVPRPTLTDLKTYAIEYFNNGFMGIIVLCLSLIGFFVLCYNYFKYKGIKIKPELFYLILTGVGFVIFSFLESMYLSPLFLKRYLLVSVIAVFPMVSFLISQISNKLIVTIVATCIFIIGILTMDFKTYKGMNLKQQMTLVKENKTKSTAVFTDNDLGVYYYDIELFKHTYDLKNAINNQDIFQVYDTTALVNIDYSRYDKVIVATTWPNTNNNIKNWLLKKYPNMKEYVNKNDACETYIYSK